VKPKTFMLIAGALAAEQRTVVAHSASYGKPCRQISQAPAGAIEKPPFNHPFLPPHPGLESFDHSFPRFHRGLLSHATPWLKQNLSDN